MKGSPSTDDEGVVRTQARTLRGAAGLDGDHGVGERVPDGDGPHADAHEVGMSLLGCVGLGRVGRALDIGMVVPELVHDPVEERLERAIVQALARSARPRAARASFPHASSTSG